MLPGAENPRQHNGLASIKSGARCVAGLRPTSCRVGVNGTHYRAAALLSASLQLAESIRAAKRFRVVPAAHSCTAANACQIAGLDMHHLSGIGIRWTQDHPELRDQSRD